MIREKYSQKSDVAVAGNTVRTEISRKGVTVRKATPQDVKTIQTHGSGCSRVLVGQGSYDMRTISLINYVDYIN